MSVLDDLAPVLRYAKGEHYRANPAEQWTSCPKTRLRRRDGTVIKDDGLTLAYLGERVYLDGQPVNEGDVIGHDGKDYLSSYRDLPSDLRRDLAYAREVHKAGRSFAVYWLWFFNNVSPLAGAHEGDWEAIIVEHEGGDPIRAGLSQHRGGQARLWRSVELSDAHLVVYPAKGTHALYFEAGETGLDRHGGRGVEARPSIEPLGPWARFPGRWGDSRGDPRRPWESTSPPSPGRQTPTTNPPMWFERLVALP